jgi:hypothetical protein
MKDAEQPIETENEEAALEASFSCIGKISDALNNMEFGSIRECLAGKVYTLTEEDTGDEMEFIKS